MRKYTETHEWFEPGESGRFGITDHAQEALGEIVFFEFLVAPGDEVAAGTPICDIESVKTSAQAYAPAAGRVEAVNGDLESDPAALNGDPYGAGWIAQLSPGAGEGLMGEVEYRAHSEAEEA